MARWSQPRKIDNLPIYKGGEYLGGLVREAAQERHGARALNLRCKSSSRHHWLPVDFI
ncbi:MAG: hypothetical protein M0022_02555 [Desulfobacteraceae bacterium]|nr:hypothetical protein [Desulfobacteraceae bacterium]